MSAFMNFRCRCGRRFGQLVRDEDERVVCPKCGAEIVLEDIRKQVDEARRSILDRAEERGESQ